MYFKKIDFSDKIIAELGKILQTRGVIWNSNNFLQKTSELHGKNHVLNLELNKTNKLLTISQSREEMAKQGKP